MSGAPAVLTGVRVGVAPRWAARVSRAHLAVGVAGLVAMVLTLAALRAAERTTPVLALRRDVAAGTRLSAADLESVRLRADPDALARLVRAGDATRAVGRVARQDLLAGELVRASDLVAAAAANAARAMSFPIDAADALAGRLAPGDRVDVVAVDRAGGGAGFVLVDAAVLAVDDGRGRGPLADAASRVTVTLAVDGDGALALARANATARITLVRSSGARPLSSAVPYAPPATTGGGATTTSRARADGG